MGGVNPPTGEPTPTWTRWQSNSVFNDVLKLGTFQTNLDSGCVMFHLDAG
jgi:hypothetical protein